MYLQPKNLTGNPNVGVFAATNDEVTLVTPLASHQFIKLAKKTLKTNVIPINICNSSLIGIFVALNNNGIAVPSTVYTDEIAQLKQYFNNVEVVDKFTALGNMVSANSNGAMASQLFPKSSIATLEKAFEVKVKPGRLAEVDTVGSSVVVTNKGFFANQNISDEEMKTLEKTFKVEGGTGTLNYGSVFVHGGMIANNNGAICGATTTPFELGRIDDALFFKKEG